MAGSPKDKRPPLVKAIEAASQATTIGLEMAVPAGVGFWLDTRFGTMPWLFIAGAVLGLMVSMWHLLQLAAKADKTRADKKRRNSNSADKNSS